jgi:flagellar protein FlaJ
MIKKDDFIELRKIISEEKKLIKHIEKNPSEILIKKLRARNNLIPNILAKISLTRPLPSQKPVEKSQPSKLVVKATPAIVQPQHAVQEDALKELKTAEKKLEIAEKKKEEKEDMKLERDVLERLRNRKKKVIREKEEKVSGYVKLANKMFSKISLSLYKNNTFSSLKKNLIQANLPYLPVSYVSTIFLTTLLAGIVAFFIFLFFLFFDLTIKVPFISQYTGAFMARFMKVVWIVIIAPVATFFIMLTYPSSERNYIKDRINQELPFVTIHMSAIAGSKIEPSKIFEIITLTREYPYVSKEFTKIINEINIYGYNLVGAIRKTALNTSSYKLAEVLNGIAITVTSGGNLDKYFEKKAQSLLFEYRLEKEKYTRLAETFMDIYISVVIAAPMILMLLLMMIKVTGIGINLTTQMLTMIIVGGVSFVNILFLTFLYFKQPEN